MAPTASTATQANQQPCVPPSFSEYAASVYGSEEAADCRLRFYVSSVSQAHTEQEQSGQADPGAGSSGTATAAQQPSRTFVGEPLPAHSLILRGTSLRLRALLSRWTDEDDQPRSGGSLPELHVLLDAAEDLGPASEVVRFCYTGQLTELDFHALLLVRRQASYLQVLNCAAACDAAMQALARFMAAQPGSEAVVAAFCDHSLFPDPELEPGFRPVQQALTSALLAHFGCAFSIMSSWARLQQWMQLPEVAVAWALASEELQTDEESSVLLLVLWWLHWQQHEAGALGWEEAGAAGRRLMQHVRLGCLSRPFLLVLLPQLEWLQLTPGQYAAVLALGTASGGAERACTSWSLGIRSGVKQPAGGMATWFAGPRKQSEAASRPLKCVRRFPSHVIRNLARLVRHEGVGEEEEGVNDVEDATDSEGTDKNAKYWESDSPWRHDSGYPLWGAAQPRGEDLMTWASPWAGGGIYQGGFFWLPELAWRLWPGSEEPQALQLCLAAHEALPISLRDRMRRHAFASVEATLTVPTAISSSQRHPGYVGRLVAGVPVPVRSWWSHDFRHAAKAVVALELPLDGGSAARLGSWARYMTFVDGSSVLSCKVELAPRPAPGTVAEPVSESEFCALVLGGVEVPRVELGPEDGAPEEEEWDWEQATTEDEEDSELESEEESEEEEEEEEEEESDEEESEWEEEEDGQAVEEVAQEVAQGVEQEAAQEVVGRGVEGQEAGSGLAIAAAAGEAAQGDGVEAGNAADLAASAQPAATREAEGGDRAAATGSGNGQLASGSAGMRRGGTTGEEAEQEEEDEGLEEGPDKAIYSELLRRHLELLRRHEELRRAEREYEAE